MTPFTIVQVDDDGTGDFHVHVVTVADAIDDTDIEHVGTFDNRRAAEHAARLAAQEHHCQWETNY